MIDSKALLAALQKQLPVLEDDLRTRIDEQPALRDSLHAEWRAASDARRSAETWETWCDAVVTQAAVHWLLSCVFARFVEDNGLIDRPWLAGPGERLALARDRHEQHFRARPHDSDRDYLIACFRDLEALPGMAELFDERHNPVFRIGISGDAAMALLAFWQRVDPDTGALVHDFTDPAWNTRFLGDLYQDLSESARKRYALLQTPDFVEEFILDRTLTPALAEFGYREVRMIDPTCGSGHFLLGGFARVLDAWARAEPGRARRDTVQRALDAVAGVDLNPFAVAIARFRLLLAALRACDVGRLAAAPAFHFHLAVGDSLLHGTRFGLGGTSGSASGQMFGDAEHYEDTGLAHAFATEDLDALRSVLGRQYHAVVGNPPYIVVRDAALNKAYREVYASCHMKYSLGAPFTERFFELALTGRDGQSAGFVGLITANSFMKREFGAKLIEEVLPRVDLTHVIDTSGAYIPGHGTPTVILFGRHRPPVSGAVRTVMGIKGEPSTPADPAQGLVWSAIVGQVDQAGSESAFVSVAETPRAVFGKHPWSIGGGGAADLKELIETDRPALKSEAQEVGISAVNGEDELYLLADRAHAKRLGLEHLRPMVTGDLVRDWVADAVTAVWLYDEDFNLLPLSALPSTARYFWPAYNIVSRRKRFGTPMVERGLTWYEYQELYVNKLRTPLTITFGEVATHNHFVLDRGGKVFNRTAPVIKLPEGATEDEHLGLLGLLNSSVACFWLQQVCHNKGGPGGGSSKDEKWHDFYALNSTKVAEFPLVQDRPVDLARSIDALAQQLHAQMPAQVVSQAAVDGGQVDRQALDFARVTADSVRRMMVALQEELDWRCYHLYGLTEEAFVCDSPPEVAPGERAFEIVMARRMRDGALETRWFEWLGVDPITEVPNHWPQFYRELVDRRIDLIEHDRSIGLVESFSCKRRWEFERWEKFERAALRDALLDRLESSRYRAEPALTSVQRLADLAREDAAFMQLAALYAGHSDFDVVALLGELVASEAVPLLPVLRYTDSGLRKRAQWEDTWSLQRREDAGEDVGRIPVPPKYQGKDFLKNDFWRLRGGLDVPKERWVSFPGCERGADGSLVVAWAGWDHLQQATALAAYYLEVKEVEGWPAERLQPLLAGLLELVPWLKQWHNAVHPEFGERMGNYYEGFVQDEARTHGFTADALRAWKPVVVAARRGRRKKA